jgi:tetratricopeptide (TPR) repeat protein
LDNIELREEIKHSGGNYLLQTSFIVQNNQVCSSFFRDGRIFDSISKTVDGELSSVELKELTKTIHKHNRDKFQFILNARDSVKTSDDPNPHLKLAEALLRRNLYEEAIVEAETALEKGAKDSRAWKVIGESWFMMDENDKAYDAITMGIELTPDYPDLHNLMGKIFMKRQMCGSAVESFKRAIELNLYYNEPYINIIKAYLLNSIIKQDYDLSRDLGDKFRTNIAKVRQLNPLISTKVLDEVEKHFAEESFEEALRVLDGIDAGQGRSIVDDIILELYLMLIQSGDKYAEADIEKYLGEIIDIVDQNPTFADAWNSLGILYTAKCKIFMDRAFEAFRKALEINGDYGKARKNLRLAENDRQGIFILLKALLD